MLRLEDLDLNLLIVFRALYRERKTTRVAELLGIGQSSVSYSLAKLRRLLGDPLFERTARGLRPTPFADRLAEPVTQALATLQDAVDMRDTFDASTSRRRFTIAMTDIGEIYFLSKLFPELSRIAPDLQISTVHGPPGELSGQMESGQVDLAVGWIPQLKGGFKQRRLFAQRYVCLMRRGHPLARGTFGMKEFRKAKHALVVFRETGHEQLVHALTRVIDPLNLKLQLPHFVAIPYILSTTDLIVTVTEALAQRAVEHFDLIARDHPLELPTIPISMYWHSRYNNDLGNRWLRSLFVANFAGN